MSEGTCKPLPRVLIEGLTLDTSSVVFGYLTNHFSVTRLVCKAWRAFERIPLNTVIESVVASGDLTDLKWALKKYGMRQDVCELAIRYGRLDTMEWAKTQGFFICIYWCNEAAARGHVHILRWLRANGASWGVDTCMYAAWYGHLGALKWLRENGCPWDECTCSHAANGGHLDALRWARANGCPWDGLLTCELAAFEGHVHILEWALANGQQWRECICEKAAIDGQLSVLQWADEKGYAWNENKCLDIATRRRHDNVRDWILERIEKRCKKRPHKVARRDQSVAQ